MCLERKENASTGVHRWGCMCVFWMQFKACQRARTSMCVCETAVIERWEKDTSSNAYVISARASAVLLMAVWHNTYAATQHVKRNAHLHRQRLFIWSWTHSEHVAYWFACSLLCVFVNNNKIMHLLNLAPSKWQTSIINEVHKTWIRYLASSLLSLMVH